MLPHAALTSKEFPTFTITTSPKTATSMSTGSGGQQGLEKKEKRSISWPPGITTTSPGSCGTIVSRYRKSRLHRPKGLSSIGCREGIILGGAISEGAALKGGKAGAMGGEAFMAGGILPAVLQGEGLINSAGA